MSNIALQLQRLAPGSADTGNPVLFDTTVYHDGDITYDPATGIVTLNEPGQYILQWFVSTQSSQIASGAVFAVSCSQGEFIMDNSPLKMGEVTGAGILQIASAPATVTLANAGPDSVFYAAQTPVKATLIVIRDDNGDTMSMECFATAQLAHILEQIIAAYSTSTWSVYADTLVSYSGMPVDLYTAPGASGPGLLRLIDINSDYELLPLRNIIAIAVGTGTVYDPAFTYLDPPDPLPQDCVADQLAAVYSLFPPGTPVSIRFGPNFSLTATVYRNEFGLLVFAGSEGETPIFVPALSIQRFFMSGDANDFARRNSLLPDTVDGNIRIERIEMSDTSEHP